MSAGKDPQKDTSSLNIKSTTLLRKLPPFTLKKKKIGRNSVELCSSAVVDFDSLIHLHTFARYAVKDNLKLHKSQRELSRTQRFLSYATLYGILTLFIVPAS